MNRAEKNELYSDLAATVKSIASPARLEILQLLGQAPRTVEEIAGEVPYSFANVSQHLQVLRAGGLVVREAEGRRARYRLAGTQVDLALGTLFLLADHLRAGFRDKHLALSGADPERERDLVERVERGDAVLIDVRPEIEFAHAHLPGARSVPPGTLDAVLDDLPRDREIVAYCRGPFCTFAREAVAQLREAGFEASVYGGHVSQWRARNLDLEMAS